MTRLHLAANQGRMSGGEEMLMRTAEAASDLGLDVVVVAPVEPDETLRAADAAGFDVVDVAGRGRADYARGLRRWDRQRTGLLWCHGLVPALATAGRPDRIVHLHQLPHGRVQQASLAVARRRARALLVPSAFMAGRLPGSRAMANWTSDVTAQGRPARTAATIGFLGRLSQDKGLDVLAAAVGILATRRPDLRLVVAGDARFVPPDQQSAVTRALRAVAEVSEMRGWIPRAEFFEDVDVAVFPSVWPEPFGLGVAEAMATGVPFVVSDAGALSEVAGPEHPWVAPAGNAEALARVLAEAMSTDPADLLRRARKRWESEYSPAAGRSRVAALLQDLGLLASEPTR